LPLGTAWQRQQQQHGEGHNCVRLNLGSVEITPLAKVNECLCKHWVSWPYLNFLAETLIL